MTDKAPTDLAAEILTEQAHITLEDLCTVCSVSSEEILTYVSEGIIQPSEARDDQRHFSQTTIIAVRRAKRLENDLGLNAAGIALALELSAQIDALKKRLARYEADQPDSVTRT
jgi:chaperone modulatory protein CbpM